MRISYNTWLTSGEAQFIYIAMSVSRVRDLLKEAVQCLEGSTGERPMTSGVSEQRRSIHGNLRSVGGAAGASAATLECSC